MKSQLPSAGSCSLRAQHMLVASWIALGAAALLFIAAVVLLDVVNRRRKMRATVHMEYLD